MLQIRIVPFNTLTWLNYVGMTKKKERALSNCLEEAIWLFTGESEPNLADETHGEFDEGLVALLSFTNRIPRLVLLPSLYTPFGYSDSFDAPPGSDVTSPYENASTSKSGMIAFPVIDINSISFQMY